MPLVRRKCLREPRRIQDLCPLLRWNLAQIDERLPHHPLPIRRHPRQRLRRRPHIRLLLRRKPFEHLIALQDPLPLLRRPRIQRPQTVQHPLLLVRRQPIEPRLPAQLLFLLLRRQILMIVQPLAQMPRPRTTAHAGPHHRWISSHPRPHRSGIPARPRSTIRVPVSAGRRRRPRCRLSRSRRSSPRCLRALPHPRCPGSRKSSRKRRGPEQNQQTQSGDTRQSGHKPASGRPAALRLVLNSRDHRRTSPRQTTKPGCKPNRAGSLLSVPISLRPLSFESPFTNCSQRLRRYRPCPADPSSSAAGTPAHFHPETADP
jgi:hypothetical protein